MQIFPWMHMITLVEVSENSPIRAGSYCQRLTYVNLRPVSEVQSAGFFVYEPLKN